MVQTIRDVQEKRGYFWPPTNNPHPHDTWPSHGQRRPTLMSYLRNTHHGQAHTLRF